MKTKFETGKTYALNYQTGHDDPIIQDNTEKFIVTKRTNKFVTVKSLNGGEEIRRKVKDYINACEVIEDVYCGQRLDSIVC